MSRVAHVAEENSAAPKLLNISTTGQSTIRGKGGQSDYI